MSSMEDIARHVPFGNFDFIKINQKFKNIEKIKIKNKMMMNQFHRFLLPRAVLWLNVVILGA